ncbi:MAG: hypothetical protein AB1489_17930 [Acidobacteriota bacterium]
MNHPEDKQPMFQYILDELSEDEKCKFEERYFDDDNFYELLLAAEDEMIDLYIRGELSQHERQQFEQRFLKFPQNRQRLEFAKALIKVVEPVAEPLPCPQQPSLMQRLGTFFNSPQTALRWSLVASLVMVVAFTWLLTKYLHLQAQVAQFQIEQTALHRQLAEEQARNEQLLAKLTDQQNHGARLNQEPQEQRPVTVPTPAVVAFVLNPLLSRSTDSSQPLILPSGDYFVQLQLKLVREDVYKNYRAELRTIEGHRVWRGDNLSLKQTNKGKSVFVTIPSRVFAKEDYILTLTGLPADNDSEEDYTFSVIKN